MTLITKYIKDIFSVYAIIVLLFSSYILIFVDRVQLKTKGLENEAKFSFTAGIILTAVAITGYIIGAFFA